MLSSSLFFDTLFSLETLRRKISDTLEDLVWDLCDIGNERVCSKGNKAMADAILLLEEEGKLTIVVRDGLYIEAEPVLKAQ